MKLRNRWFALAALTSTLLAVAGTTPATATAAYRFGFLLEANDFDVFGPADTDVTLRVRDGATIVDTTSAHTNANGRVHAAFFGAGHLAPGFVLSANDGVHSRSLTIPNVTVHVDRVADRVTGTGPPNRNLRIQVLDCTVSDQECSVAVTRTVPTGASGHFATDVTTSFNLRGKDVVSARFTTVQQDTATRQLSAPAFGIDPALSEVFGCIEPSTTVRLLLAPGGQQIEQNVGQGCFSVPFNHAFNMGNQVTADFATDAKMTVPGISMSHSGTVVTARCLLSSPISLEWFSDQRHKISGTTAASGAIVRDFAADDPTVNMSGLEVKVECELSRGDRVEFRHQFGS